MREMKCSPKFSTNVTYNVVALMRQLHIMKKVIHFLFGLKSSLKFIPCVPYRTKPYRASYCSIPNWTKNHQKLFLHVPGMRNVVNCTSTCSGSCKLSNHLLWHHEGSCVCKTYLKKTLKIIFQFNYIINTGTLTAWNPIFLIQNVILSTISSLTYRLGLYRTSKKNDSKINSPN